MKKSLILLPLMSAFTAFAQISPLEYTSPTPISSIEANEVWSSMKTGFKKNSECFNRAMTWSYDIKKQFGFEGKRIYIHFSYLYNKELSSGWGYHTAPVYNVDGEDIVFDKGFGAWVHTPLSKEMWEDKFILVANDKLVSKRIKLVQKIEKAQNDLAKLSRSDSTYDSKLQDIRKYNDELVLLKVTDKDLLAQKPKKIERINRWINFLQAEIPKYENNYNVLNQLKRDLRYYEDQLEKIKTDLSYAALVSCEKITHIEELDYNKTGAWCFIQEASNFYWGVPQLRNLNYGAGYGLTKVPLVSELPERHLEGEKYIKKEFDMGEVWAARKQAFGNDAEKLWADEYKLKKDSENAVKNIYKVTKNANSELKNIQKSLNNSRSLLSKHKSLSRYTETLNAIENDSNKNSEVLENAQKTILSMVNDISVEATQTKVEAYSQAKRAKENLESLAKKAKDLEKTLKSLAKKL